MRQTVDSTGAVVHEDTPRKVMYVTAAGARVATKPDTPGMPNFGTSEKSAGAPLIAQTEQEDECVKSLF